ncbi:MAG: peptidoglycan-binding protein [Candidatus Eremiobacteraeota bacterium]|nr:peptidoglycan-binding protein [Candidatus Eremiobacteraeota bacterium]MCW5868411.1 peptidoglycan-binding protein [Candidatus Eremiobacteraeota bacterium]
MTAIKKQTGSVQRASSSGPKARTKKASQAPSKAQKTRSQQPNKVDQTKFSQDLAVQSNQKQVPNFQSWASPNAAKSAELKPLSGDNMSRRDKGDNVKQLQEHLNKAGAKLETDGKFGPETQKAVRKFQRQHNLTVDGKVGPETMGALNKGLKPEPTNPKPDPAAKQPDPAAQKPDPGAKKPDPGAQKPDPAAKVDPGAKKAQGLPQLADKKMSTQEKYDHYAAMVKAAGGKIDGKNPTVLGLRGLGIDGKRHDSGRNTGSNDDTFVVLGRDKKGQPTVTELSGATHAATARGSVAGGVAQLRPGNYDVTRRHDYKGHEAWAVNGGGNVPAYRDGNRDGKISDAEKANAVKRGTTADGILFHWDRNASIGCQTLPIDQLKKLKAAVNGGNFHYTLLDANQAQH